MDFLQRGINEFWIPEAAYREVYREIIAKGKERPGTAEVLHGKWIKRGKISDKTRVNLFASELGL